VPQRGQKLRVPCSEDEKRVGCPAVKAKSGVATVNHVTKAALAVRRQIEQWQWVSWKGVPRTR
jgi:hypothetical protein